MWDAQGAAHVVVWGAQEDDYREDEYREIRMFASQWGTLKILLDPEGGRECPKKMVLKVTKSQLLDDDGEISTCQRIPAQCDILDVLYMGGSILNLAAVSRDER